MYQTKGHFFREASLEHRLVAWLKNMQGRLFSWKKDHFEGK
jgi:hypothetical protein